MSSNFSNSNIKEFFKSHNIPTMSPNQVARTDKPISQREKTETKLQSVKSLGHNELPYTFYQKLFNLPLPIPSTMYSESLAAGSLPPFLSWACITLLAKKDKDPLKCRSKRPISLLNFNYKILAKVLEYQLVDILPTIIYPDQAGFVKKT